MKNVPTFEQTRNWLFRDGRITDPYAVPFAALANRAASAHRTAERLAEIRHRHIVEGVPRKAALDTQHAVREHLRSDVHELLYQLPRTRRDFALFGALSASLRAETGT